MLRKLVLARSDIGRFVFLRLAPSLFVTEEPFLISIFSNHPIVAKINIPHLLLVFHSTFIHFNKQKRLGYHCLHSLNPSQLSKSSQHGIPYATDKA